MYYTTLSGPLATLTEVKVFSHVRLCNPIDYIAHGILQARILEWVAFPFPGDFPNPGIEPGSPALQADSSPSEPAGKPIIKYMIANIFSRSVGCLFILLMLSLLS